MVGPSPGGGVGGRFLRSDELSIADVTIDATV